MSFKWHLPNSLNLKKREGGWKCIRNGNWTDGQNGQERSKGDRRSDHYGIKIYKRHPVELLIKSYQVLRMSIDVTINSLTIRTKLTDGQLGGGGGGGKEKPPQYFSCMSVV